MWSRSSNGRGDWTSYAPQGAPMSVQAARPTANSTLAIAVLVAMCQLTLCCERDEPKVAPKVYEDPCDVSADGEPHDTTATPFCRVKCHNDSNCLQDGLCEAVTSTTGTVCRATAAGCAESWRCVHFGACGLASDATSCIVTAEGCRASVGCKTGVNCGLVEGACAPTTVEHCGCEAEGSTADECEVVSGKCRYSDSACKGKCGAEKECRGGWGGCYPATPKGCETAEECAVLGLCSLVDGRCGAGSQADCDEATYCSGYSSCKLAKVGQACVPKCLSTSPGTPGQMCPAPYFRHVDTPKYACDATTTLCNVYCPECRLGLYDNGFNSFDPTYLLQGSSPRKFFELMPSTPCQLCGTRCISPHAQCTYGSQSAP